MNEVRKEEETVRKIRGTYFSTMIEEIYYKIHIICHWHKKVYAGLYVDMVIDRYNTYIKVSRCQVCGCNNTRKRFCEITQLEALPSCDCFSSNLPELSEVLTAHPAPLTAHGAELLDDAVPQTFHRFVKTLSCIERTAWVHVTTRKIKKTIPELWSFLQPFTNPTTSENFHFCHGLVRMINTKKLTSPKWNSSFFTI